MPYAVTSSNRVTRHTDRRTLPREEIPRMSTKKTMTQQRSRQSISCHTILPVSSIPDEILNTWWLDTHNTRFQHTTNLLIVNTFVMQCSILCELMRLLVVFLSWRLDLISGKSLVGNGDVFCTRTILVAIIEQLTIE